MTETDGKGAALKRAVGILSAVQTTEVAGCPQHVGGAATAPRISQCYGWRLSEYTKVDSTNLTAVNLPAWSAVRADMQTCGRGRFERSWVSDEGGLWLSAVVPVNDGSPDSRLLPLIAGLVVVEVCKGLGVQRARMRWPNDVLVGDQKLAGLLVDQFKPHLAVAGIGINAHNHPEACDPNLSQQTARLADLIEIAPGLRELAALVLKRLQVVHQEVLVGGFACLLPRINALWGEARVVKLECDRGEMTGRFAGVDGVGRLRLIDEQGMESFHEAREVKLLREV